MNIVYICTGNTCRSPLAEYYSRQTYPGHQFKSAGLYPSDQVMAKPSRDLLREEGIDSRGFRPQGLSLDLVQWADYLVPMEETQAGFIRDLAPGKIYNFWDHGGTQVPDPYEASFLVYQVTYKVIKENVDQMMADLEGRK